MVQPKLVTKIDRNFIRLLRLKSLEFEYQANKAIQSLLLSRVLLQCHNCFPRFVLQSEKNNCPPPYGSEYDRIIMPEIGVINGKRLFFEVINPDMPSVNLHQEKNKSRTIPPTIVYCYQSKKLVRAVLKSLDQRKLEKVEKPINVPEGFYVFEFTAQEDCGSYERKKTIVTATPFPAKNIRDAIRILKLWPDGSYYRGLSNFRLCVSKGWVTLNSKRQQGNASLSDYEISPK